MALDWLSRVGVQIPPPPLVLTSSYRQAISFTPSSLRSYRNSFHEERTCLGGELLLLFQVHCAASSFHFLRRYLSCCCNKINDSDRMRMLLNLSSTFPPSNKEGRTWPLNTWKAEDPWYIYSNVKRRERTTNYNLISNKLILSHRSRISLSKEETKITRKSISSLLKTTSSSRDSIPRRN